MRYGLLLRTFVWIAAFSGIVFVALQFIRPELTNPPVTADLEAPPEVQQILRTSCYNCHSNETRLPWFDRIVPAYWIAVRDVREGRKHLNFSEIGKLPTVQQTAALYESVSQIELGAMPLPAYKRVHPESIIASEQLAVLKKYLTSANPNLASSPAEIAAAPNGIAFLLDYKNWKAISSTERFDNHTMRQILGNDVAVKAIAENHINPWPDGTVFAKVAWQQAQPDNQGVA